MKSLILTFTFAAAISYGQDKSPVQPIPPPKLLIFPPQPVNPSIWGAVQGLDLYKDFKQTPIQGREIELKGFTPLQVPSGVCSVPLLEAHVNAADPGIAVMPGNSAVPIPQAHVPAPACQKK